MSELGKCCKHGSLARSCYTCELELENKELKESMACQGEEKDPSKHGCCNCFYIRYGELNSENKRLREVLERISKGFSYERHAGMDSASVSATRDHLRLWAQEALRGGGE